MIVYRLTSCNMKGLERGKVADSQTRQTCYVDYYTTTRQRGEEWWLICTSCQMQRVDNTCLFVYLLYPKGNSYFLVFVTTAHAPVSLLASS